MYVYIGYFVSVLLIFSKIVEVIKWKNPYEECISVIMDEYVS